MIEPTNELTALATAPEKYVRINVTKNSKGYSHETTVSLRWTDKRPDGEDPSDQLERMLRASDLLARAEIVDRERRDVEGTLRDPIAEGTTPHEQ